MVTKNLKRLLGLCLQSTSTVLSTIEAIDVYGNTYYLTPNVAFPGSRAETYTLNQYAAGVSFGTGNSVESEDDFNLENTITSGINVVLTSREVSTSKGNPCLLYRFTITNNGSNSITISEVGYKQALKGTYTPGRAESQENIYLLDRTVLDTPLTIASGDAGVLVYELKTVIEEEKTISGVSIVPFSSGTDYEIGAMIDAARNGTINLQTDGGWKIGNMRKIHLSSFVDGKGTTHNEQDIDIIITSFDDYNNCGCLFQFDFYESLATEVRMNPTNTTEGGYGGSEMFTTTLPALVNALPSWLKNRLKTFDVLARVGGSNVSAVETVSGNKLALRSTQEVFGTETGEGTQLAYYNSTSKRTKKGGYSGPNKNWWERSAYSGSAFLYVYNGTVSYDLPATHEVWVAPFGCI